jgi:hypothetical protein
VPPRPLSIEKSLAEVSSERKDNQHSFSRVQNPSTSLMLQTTVVTIEDNKTSHKSFVWH